MDAIRQYFLSVTTAAIICAVLKALPGSKGITGGIVKLICGLFLAFTVIRPVTDIRIEDFSVFIGDISADAQTAISIGEDFSRDNLAALIKEEAEAYILDKAQALNADIQVTVAVSRDSQPSPEEVYITGNVSPYIKAQLQKIITEDLGVAKEYQIWIS